MHKRRNGPAGRHLALAAIAAMAVTATTAQEAPSHRDPATQTCENYPQDVTRDVAMLLAEGEPLVSAADAGTELPQVSLSRHHVVRLHPQAEVNFSTPPSRVMLADGSFAGIMSFRVAESGSYRISLTGETWVDVLVDGEHLDARAFAGRTACKPLRKLVEYVLEADTQYTLLLSGGSTETLGMLIHVVEQP